MIQKEKQGSPFLGKDNRLILDPVTDRIQRQVEQFLLNPHNLDQHGAIANPNAQVIILNNPSLAERAKALDAQTDEYQRDIVAFRTVANVASSVLCNIVGGERFSSMRDKLLDTATAQVQVEVAAEKFRQFVIRENPANTHSTVIFGLAHQVVKNQTVQARKEMYEKQEIELAADLRNELAEAFARESDADVKQHLGVVPLEKFSVQLTDTLLIAMRAEIGRILDQAKRADARRLDVSFDAGAKAFKLSDAVVAAREYVARPDHKARILANLREVFLGNKTADPGNIQRGTSAFAGEVWNLMWQMGKSRLKPTTEAERGQIVNARKFAETYEEASLNSQMVNVGDVTDLGIDDTSFRSKRIIVPAQPREVIVDRLACLAAIHGSRIISDRKPYSKRLTEEVIASLKKFDLATSEGRGNTLGTVAVLGMTLAPVAAFIQAFQEKSVGTGISGAQVDQFTGQNISTAVKAITSGIALLCTTTNCAPIPPPNKDIPIPPPIGPAATSTPFPDATPPPPASSQVEFNLIPGGADQLEAQKTFDAVKAIYSARQPAVSGQVSIDIKIADKIGRIATVEKTMFIRTDSGLINPLDVNNIFASDPQLAQRINDGFFVKGNVRIIDIVNNLLIYTQYLPQTPGRTDGTTIIPPKGQVRKPLAAVDITTGKVVPLKESSLISLKGKVASLSFDGSSGNFTNQDIEIIQAPNGDYYLIPAGTTLEQLQAEFPDVFPAPAVEVSPESRFPQGVVRSQGPDGKTLFILPGILDPKTGQPFALGELDRTGKVIEYNWVRVPPTDGEMVILYDNHSTDARGIRVLERGTPGIVTNVYKDASGNVWFYVNIGDKDKNVFSGLVKGWVSAKSDKGAALLAISKGAQAQADRAEYVPPTGVPAATRVPEKTYNNVLFSADFSDGHGAPDSSVEGTSLETIPDPTGSGRGNVVIAKIIGDPVKQGKDYFAYRGHVGLQIDITGEARFENDVYVSKQFFNDAMSGARWWIDQNIFDDKSIWHVAIRTSLNRDGYMIMYINGGGGDAISVPLPDAPKFTAEAWHAMAIEIREVQNEKSEKIWMAYLFQNKHLVSSSELPKSLKKDANGKPKWEAEHIGPIYAGAMGLSMENARFSRGGYVLEDNMRILTP